jgi:hypothetical protein
MMARLKLLPPSEAVAAKAGASLMSRLVIESLEQQNKEEKQQQQQQQQTDTKASPGSSPQINGPFSDSPRRLKQPPSSRRRVDTEFSSSSGSRKDSISRREKRPSSGGIELLAPFGKQKPYSRFGAAVLLECDFDGDRTPDLVVSQSTEMTLQNLLIIFPIRFSLSAAVGSFFLLWTKLFFRLGNAPTALM